MKRALPLVAAVWMSMMAGQGQTAVDLRTQSKSVDFSGALSTKPVKTGTSLPATCQIGELFFRTDIPAGQNLYGCTSADLWRQMTTGGSMPALTPVAFSPTPTFPITNTTQGFTITLTGAATASAFSGTPSDGQEVWFRVCQDAAGGHAFTYPASVRGGDTIDTAGNACTTQLFRYIAALATYAAITGGKSDNATPGLVTPAGTINLPSAPDTLVGRTSTDTLSNKTFVAPALGTPASAVLTNATGLPLTTGVAGTLGAANGGAGNSLRVRTCVVATGDPGSASPVLTNDNDSPAACGNTYGVDWSIMSVSCWSNAGSPTVTPILTGGSATSILTSALTCGTAVWAAGTVNGTPVLHSFGADGAACSSAPCTADVNITNAGGVAKYIVVRITGMIANQ